MKIVKLMFDGEQKECLVQTDQNGETVCKAKDGRFIKFAAGVDLKAAIKRHNKYNSEKRAVPGETEDVTAANDAEFEKWLSEDDEAEDEPANG